MVHSSPPKSTRQQLEKIPNVPGLYRHRDRGTYYAIKKVLGKRKEHSLGTKDRKLAERRMKEWLRTLDKIDSAMEHTTLKQLLEMFAKANQGKADKTQKTNASIIKQFKLSWGYDLNMRVGDIRASHLNEWLAIHGSRLKHTSYNRYAGFLKQLFAIAVADRIIAESPFESVATRWKKPQTPLRMVPTVEQFEQIIAFVRNQKFNAHAKETADFLEFLGLAGVGQAEASSLTWGDVDWKKQQIHIRRRKTQHLYYVPIYDHLKPLLQRLHKEAKHPAPSKKVFAIQDAKKALETACKKLGLTHFSQRNLRQCLILRLWMAGVDVKLIAKWQGHQDGGKLIFDTYTEAFGSRDGEYEQEQLKKLGVQATPASTAAVTPVAPNSSPMTPTNTFKEGDKVFTLFKGTQVTAEVTLTYANEVQVRTPDGELRWRTVKTVALVPSCPPYTTPEPQSQPPTQPVGATAPVTETLVEPTPVQPTPTEVSTPLTTVEPTPKVSKKRKGFLERLRLDKP
ncbi:MAG: hypothetical protein B9S32_03695 [Verrucomicrobia bacterium Tous-C9LFEB]|nr:MAG: hypothetical protein B9S32_03695 [Verrucomicrobia bacterium Tous-C9LFEB]